METQNSDFKKEVAEIIQDYKNKPNKDLIKAMDLLTQDFEYTKNTLIALSKHLDKLEFTYNTILKEYTNRTK
jgi:hypothetical protein